MPASEPVQVHLGLTFKQQPAQHPQVKDYLARGFRIVNVQRVNDREALVTLSPPASPASVVT